MPVRGGGTPVGAGDRHPPQAGESEQKVAQTIEGLGGRVQVQVVAIDLSFTKAKDADLKGLKELKSLQTLNLRGTGMTDAGLKDLAPLENLQSLGLFTTKITDVGLKEIKNLKKLQELIRWNTKVTDAGMKDLKELADLRILDLRGTQQTDGVERTHNPQKLAHPAPRHPGNR